MQVVGNEPLAGGEDNIKKMKKYMDGPRSSEALTHQMYDPGKFSKPY